MSAHTAKHVLTFEGCNFFRHRIVLSVLSCKSIRISHIRSDEEEPGLKEYELNFLNLIDKVTNGTRIEINETGTSLYFKPGLLWGGKVQHECSVHRSIGYYLESLVCLAPFCKKALNVTLTGVTNDHLDPSVDAIKQASLPVLRKFLNISENLDVKIVSRGVKPVGGGMVQFTAPVCRYLKPVQFVNSGKIKRIRGWAYSVHVSPATGNRIVDGAKGILLKFLPDVYIYTDHCKGKGRSPGFGICLVAETMGGTFYAVDAASKIPEDGDEPSVPEDIGKEGASLLLKEIFKGGCVDSSNQSLACLLMALGQTDVSKYQTGPLTPFTIGFLRHLRDFFNIVFKIEQQKQMDDVHLGSEKVLLTCIGVGFSNINKTVS